MNLSVRDHMLVYFARYPEGELMPLEVSLNTKRDITSVYEAAARMVADGLVVNAGKVRKRTYKASPALKAKLQQ